MVDLSMRILIARRVAVVVVTTTAVTAAAGKCGKHINPTKNKKKTGPTRSMAFVDGAREHKKNY